MVRIGGFRKILCCALVAVVIAGAARDGYAWDGRVSQRHGRQHHSSHKEKNSSVSLNKPSVLDEKNPPSSSGQDDAELGAPGALSAEGGDTADTNHRDNASTESATKRVSETLPANLRSRFESQTGYPILLQMTQEQLAEITRGERIPGLPSQNATEKEQVRFRLSAAILLAELVAPDKPKLHRGSSPEEIAEASRYLEVMGAVWGLKIQTFHDVLRGEARPPETVAQDGFYPRENSSLSPYGHTAPESGGNGVVVSVAKNGFSSFAPQGNYNPAGDPLGIVTPWFKTYHDSGGNKIDAIQGTEDNKPAGFPRIGTVSAYEYLIDHVSGLDMTSTSSTSHGENEVVTMGVSPDKIVAYRRYWKEVEIDLLFDGETQEWRPFYTFTRTVHRDPDGSWMPMPR